MSESPWLTTEDLAALLRYATVSGARKWARQHGLIPVRRGKALLWARRDVQAQLTIHALKVVGPAVA